MKEETEEHKIMRKMQAHFKVEVQTLSILFSFNFDTGIRNRERKLKTGYNNAIRLKKC